MMDQEQDPELLKDIKRILCGRIAGDGGPTTRIDKSLVPARFREQIAVFAEKWSVFYEAKGYKWDDDLGSYVPSSEGNRYSDEATSLVAEWTYVW